MITDEENDRRTKLMEDFLKARSTSCRGRTVPFLRDERVIPRLPRPIPGEHTDAFVRRNKDLLLRIIEDMYLVIAYYWNPVDRTRTEYVLSDFRAPLICRDLEIPYPAGIAVLKELFGLDKPSADYISTTNYYPVHVVAGAAFLFETEHPLHHKLWINAMITGPEVFMQARYLLSLTPCRSYKAKGMPPRPPPRLRPSDSQADFKDKEEKNQKPEQEGQLKEVPGNEDTFQTKEATEKDEDKDEPPKDELKEDPRSEPKFTCFQKLIRGVSKSTANIREAFRGFTGRKKKDRSTIPPKFKEPEQGHTQGEEEKAEELKNKAGNIDTLREEERLREEGSAPREELFIPTDPVPAVLPPPKPVAEPFDGYDYMNKCVKAMWDTCEKLERDVVPPPERPYEEDSSSDEE